MNQIEQQFVRLSFIEGKRFAEIEEALGIDRKDVVHLWVELTDKRKEVGKIKHLYNRKGYTTIPFSQFYDMYLTHERKCCYCGITQAEIDQLFARNLVNTSRQVTRGRSLELERVSPKESYEVLNNLKLACYWCNNAKLDEFTEEEFKPIAAEIGKALRKRLTDGNG